MAPGRTRRHKISIWNFSGTNTSETVWEKKSVYDKEMRCYDTHSSCYEIIMAKVKQFFKEKFIYICLIAACLSLVSNFFFWFDNFSIIKEFTTWHDGNIYWPLPLSSLSLCYLRVSIAVQKRDLLSVSETHSDR